MRAQCIAQGVIVTRSIEASEVMNPRRGSNPARQTLERKPFPTRRDFRPTFHGPPHADTPAICAPLETALIDAAAT